MDRVRVSDAFHNRLLHLEQPEKGRPHRARYGALAACAVLLVGVAVYAAGSGLRTRPGENFRPDAEPVQCAAPTAPAGPENTDIALVEPGDVEEPGMKTIPGFEVRENRAGVDIASYYVLPWIDYGSKDAVISGTQASLISRDYAAPEGSTFRELTRDDILAVVGGGDALSTLLSWDGFEFSGSATFNADGSVWELSLSGKRDDFFFWLELAPGALPLTCVVVEPHTTTEIWGVEVTGRYGGIHGEGENREVWMPESREVEFLANGVGCRFALYGLEGESEAVETMVSRFVRHAILEGLDLTALNAGGSLPTVDPTVDPGFSVGEPNWNDSGEEASTPPSQGEAAPSAGPGAE